MNDFGLFSNKLCINIYFEFTDLRPEVELSGLYNSLFIRDDGIRLNLNRRVISAALGDREYERTQRQKHYDKHFGHAVVFNTDNVELREPTDKSQVTRTSMRGVK